MTERVKKLIEKYSNEIQQRRYLPIFLDALVEGGIELLDEVRAVFECAGIDLKDADFTRLR